MNLVVFDAFPLFFGIELTLVGIQNRDQYAKSIKNRLFWNCSFMTSVGTVLRIFFVFTLSLIYFPSAHAGWWGRVVEALPAWRVISRSAAWRAPLPVQMRTPQRALRLAQPAGGEGVRNHFLPVVQTASPRSLPAGSLIIQGVQRQGASSSSGFRSYAGQSSVFSWIVGSVALFQVLDRCQAGDRLSVDLERGSSRQGLEPSEVNAQLHEWFSSSALLPGAMVGYVSALYPELDLLFKADAHVSEGYSIGEHTALALNWLENQKKHYPLDEITQRYPELGNLHELLRVALLLHDVGKSLGPADEQLQNTLPIAEKYLRAWGFSDHQVKVALMWIQGPSYGELIKEEVELSAVLEKVISQAKDSGVRFSDWLELSFLFYLADAGSYPFVRENFFTVEEDGKLRSISTALNELLDHGRAMADLQSLSWMNDAGELDRLIRDFVPKGSSVENQVQLAQYRKHVTDEDRDQALEQLNYDFYSFFPLLPIGTTQQQEQLEKFLFQVQNDVEHLIWILKHRNHKPRPFVEGASVDPSLSSFSLESFDPSFPSGHAAHAQLHGLILSELYPQQAEEIRKHAQSIGHGRVILGLHYPSDVEAGRTLANQVFPFIQTQSDFVELVRSSLKM